MGLLGQGEMFSPETGVSDAKSVLENHDLTPLKLKPKEGLALINGTQFISTIGSECLVRAENALRKMKDFFDVKIYHFQLNSDFIHGFHT